MIEGLKPHYHRILRPAAKALAGMRVHPNVLTCLGVVLFAGAGWLTAAGRWHAALALVVVGSCMDGLDGLLASLSGSKSTFGAILDSTCDRITEIIWFGGVAAYYLLTPSAVNHPVWSSVLLSGTALSGSLMVSYVKARCEGAGVECRVGLMQRPERLVIISFCLLLGPEVMYWGMMLLSVSTWFTVGQRIAAAAQGRRGKGAEEQRCRGAEAQ